MKDNITILQLPENRFNEICGMETVNSSIRRKNLADGCEICVIADFDGIIIGEINIMFMNDVIPAAVIPNKRAYLYGYHVKEELRGFGVGRLLLWEAIRICVMRGYSEQTIAAEKGNDGIKLLYEKAGFMPFLENCTENIDGREIAFDLYIRTSIRGKINE